MASLTIRYHPQAADELDEALQWYGERDLKAAERFGELYLRMLQEASSSPQHWPLQRDGTRQIHLRPFSYYLIVREIKDHLEVVAVAHTSRRPRYWKSRL